MNWSKSSKVFRTSCRVPQAHVLANHKRHFISLMLAVVLVALNAPARGEAQIQTQAQAGDWQAVQGLRPGTRITVKARHRVLCTFQAATDDELVCRPWRFLRRGPAESRFDRQSVREVRVERNQAKDMWIGAGIGAGGGAIAGASKSTDNRGFNALIGGLSGALVGTVVGGIVSIPMRGKLI